MVVSRDSRLIPCQKCSKTIAEFDARTRQIIIRRPPDAPYIALDATAPITIQCHRSTLINGRPRPCGHINDSAYIRTLTLPLTESSITA